MTAYELTPVGPDGSPRGRSQVVYGHDLDRVRLLLKQLDEAAEEIRKLGDRTRAAEEAAVLAIARWEAEVDMRITAQARLNLAAVALSTISHRHPQVRPLVEEWRRSIWGPE